MTMEAASSGASIQTEDQAAHEARAERRRCPRFQLDLAVNLHVAWRSNPVTVEMIDIGELGVRFRARGPALQVDEEASFGFVVPGQQACVANGRVVRVQGGAEAPASVVGQTAGERAGDGAGDEKNSADPPRAGGGDPAEFVISIDRANAAFHAFVGSLAN